MNRLREIREIKKMTLEQVAKGAETSIQQVQRLEKGDRRLTTVWITRLSKALGVRPSEIVPDLADESYPPDAQELLDIYLTLADEEREAFLKILRGHKRIS